MDPGEGQPSVRLLRARATLNAWSPWPPLFARVTKAFFNEQARKWSGDITRLWDPRFISTGIISPRLEPWHLDGVDLAQSVTRVSNCRDIMNIRLGGDVNRNMLDIIYLGVIIDRDQNL